MKRSVCEQLLKWKSADNRKPLIIKGARQVGKTYTVLEFGKEQYANTIYCNFEGNEQLAAIFARDLNPNRIIKELEALYGQTIIEGHTLLFFDEIQTCEMALTSLKYFCENAPRYHLIAAGSLFGVAVNREKYSFPVGKVDMLDMYPFSFEEYLLAIEQGAYIDLIRNAYSTNSEFSLHEQALDLFYGYVTTGGMPRAIMDYIEKNDYDHVISTQRNINNSYIADMAKYATPSETARIMAVYGSIPAQLAKDNRKFQYKVVKSGARAYEYESAIDWLRLAGIITKCTRISEGKVPINVYADHNAFKTYMVDSGLLWAKYGLRPALVLGDTSGYENIKGALIENCVCSALTINGFEPYYWESSGIAEVDFVIQTFDGQVIPIEVKSSVRVRSKSLAQFVKSYPCEYAIRISTKISD